jgi:quercetin dioxygenase-like cupin family protein
MEETMNRRFLAFSIALAAAFGGGVLFSNFVAAQGPVPPRQVLREDLNGLDGQEVVMQEVTLAPGGGTPWHIHADGHEISYVLSGTPTLEVEGKGATALKAGDGFHIQPGVVHRGINTGSEPAKLVVVRVNAKGKPLATAVKR